MAKTPKRKKPKRNSTTRAPSPHKLSLKRNSKTTAKALPEEFSVEIVSPSGRKYIQNYFRFKVKAGASLTDCMGCCDCTTLAAGGVWTCEDGVCTYIPKPDYYAVLVSDPNFALPYWSRPSDLGLNCPTAPVPLGKKVARSNGRKK